MAKIEGEVADPFLPREPQSSQQSYYDEHAPTKEREQPPYLVAPFRPNRVRSNITICCIFYHANLIILVVLLFLIAVGLVLWPSQPEIQVIHVQLNHTSVSKGIDTIVFLDTSMDIKILLMLVILSFLLY
ncbi:hypothetical protein Taro_045381 [Colocasia esculenta]|uniref:Uncharacterized protein n=1 Tax=Colocasia esculenta TaxID=4460 RepID=A0A843WWF6_COLES|nr:hypothetical protein [Colocasia esculenta]